MAGTKTAPAREGHAVPPDAEDRRRANLLAARMRDDQDYAAAERERRRRINHDTTLDPRLRDLYLDDTILNTEEVTRLAEVSVQKVWGWRSPAWEEFREQPHPRMLPLPDVALGRVGGKDVPGIKKGKVIEWLIATHRHLFDAATGETVKNPNPPRHGAPRKHN